ncbi:hypothetical protein APF79_01265 [bacterium BRH_c32]|nr:MAG: hypothetical protein APF79_01265 [bacterium BRH_c32]
MKRIVILLILLTGTIIPQKIGKLAPPPEREIFPNNSWGMDIMFGEGGFGLGTFLRREVAEDLTGFIDISFSESKDEREVEYIDYWGNSFTFNKKNRVFLLPLNLGLQFRLFSESITDNLRPYVNFGVGPTLVVSTPYEKEFFSSFGKARGYLSAGGYVGFGANFGISKRNLIGINARYYYIHMFNEGVENINNRFRKDFGHFYITLNVGIMY